MASLSRIKIKITVNKIGEAIGELIRFQSPRTVEAIVKALPAEGVARVWGEEVYFSTLVKVGAEKSRNNVDSGDLAYWPEGNSFCIFYSKMQPYGRVNIIGKIVENLDLFRSVKDGDIIKVELYKS